MWRFSGDISDLRLWFTDEIGLSPMRGWGRQRDSIPLPESYNSDVACFFLLLTHITQVHISNSDAPPPPSHFTVSLTFGDLWWVKQHLVSAALWKSCSWLKCVPGLKELLCSGAICSNLSWLGVLIPWCPIKVLRSRQLFLNFNLFKLIFEII